MGEKRPRADRLLSATAGREINTKRETVVEQPTSAARVPTEVHERASDAAFEDAFTVTMPDTIEGDTVNKDTEGQNREKMFQLRKELLKSPTGVIYAWIPQAVTDFIWSQQGGFSDNFGAIRGLHVDPKRGKVQILVRTDVYKEAQPFELSIDELRDFSVELKLEKMEEETGQDPIQYSDEMQASVDALPEGVAYRWDIVTRAARQEDRLKEAEQTTPFRVSPTGQAFSSADGIGVFMNEGLGKSHWSVAKVTDQEIPFTPHEKDALRRADYIARIQEIDPMIRELFSAAEYIIRILEEKHDFDSIKAERGWGAWKAGFRDLFESVANRSGDYLKMRELSKLIFEAYDFDSRYLSLSDDVRNHVFTQKRTYEGGHPFECTELPDELADRMKKAGEEARNLLVRVAEFLQKNAEQLRRVLPAPESTSDKFDKKRIERANRSLEEISDPAKVQEVSRLLTSGEEEKKK